MAEAIRCEPRGHLWRYTQRVDAQVQRIRQMLYTDIQQGMRPDTNGVIQALPDLIEAVRLETLAEIAVGQMEREPELHKGCEC